MRTFILLAPLALVATPALAQSMPIPPALTDPATADKVTDAMQALTQAFLDLPVGKVKAAVEGRQLTPEDRNLTIRDLGRRDDPNFDRDVQQRIAQARPAMRQGMEALATALPHIMSDLDDVQETLGRATANLPQPGYPRR